MNLWIIVGILIAILLILGLVAVVQMLPDIRRYLRMRSM